MKQKRVTWQEATGSRIETKYVSDEVTCPVCESYSIVEQVADRKCRQCGQTWVTSALRK